jgi:hypothetical protein
MNVARHLAGEVSFEEQVLAAALLELQRVADRLSRMCREGLLALQASSGDPKPSSSTLVPMEARR